LAFGHHLAAQGMQGVEQANGKGGTGPHAAASGQVAIVVEFDVAINFEKAKRLADDGVADIANLTARFDLPIDETDPMLEERGQMPTAEVAVFVDGGGEDRAAVGTIPPRVVGASSKEGDPKRSSANDHSVDPQGAAILACAELSHKEGKVVKRG
jgi:hypothetical protein